MYSVMSGYTDKALTYADKAFQFMNASPNQKNGEPVHMTTYTHSVHGDAGKGSSNL